VSKHAPLARGSPCPPESFARREPEEREERAYVQVSDFLFTSTMVNYRISVISARRIYSYGDAARKSPLVLTSREKRGTVAGAIIGAIVTIESHYRGIMCSAARNSERVDAPPPLSRRLAAAGRLEGREIDSFLRARLSPCSPAPPPPRVSRLSSCPRASCSSRWKVSTRGRARFSYAGNKKGTTALSSNGRRF